MANLWSNTIAQDYVLTLKNSTKTSAVMPGIQSATQEDLIVYDTEVYRDTIDAAFMGTGRTLNLTEGGGDGLLVSNGTLVSSTSAGGAFVFGTPSDPHLEESDEFTHTPPNPLAKTRSIFYFWSGATGTGNVIAACWADQFIAITPVQVQRF
jgi:hypothetical protein